MPGQLSHSRFLLRELVVRDIRSRYLGSLGGLFWSVLNPLLQLTLYSIVFSTILGQTFDRSGSTGRFALFLFCALLPWGAVQESTTRAAQSFLENANLIRKVHFPLASLPVSLVLSALIHQVIATLLFVAILAAIGQLSTPGLVWLPLLMVFQAALMTGLSCAIAALNVFVRDIAQMLGVGFLFLFWATPIVYPRHIVPAPWDRVLAINPLTHLVEAYRTALLGQPGVSWMGQTYWILISLFTLLLGWWLLAKLRGRLLDLV